MPTPKFATLKQNGWTLNSAEERSQSAPATFEIPSLDKRTNLQVDQVVKLLFEIEPEKGHDPSIERMWVKITERNGDRYIGVLDNSPFATRSYPQHELQAGVKLIFLPEHICGINRLYH